MPKGLGGPAKDGNSQRWCAPAADAKDAASKNRDYAPSRPQGERLSARRRQNRQRTRAAALEPQAEASRVQLVCVGRVCTLR